MGTLKKLWSEHRTATLVGGAVALVAIGGLVGYLILKRPADVSNPDAAFEVTDQGQEPIGVANWPLYGLNPQRTRYLPTEGVKPPFRVAWTFNGRKLLEYSPVLHGEQIFGINNNGEAFSVKTRNGKIRWRREIARLNAAAPAYHDKWLYFANLEPGQVLGVSAKTGNTRWKRPLPGRTETSPVVVKDRLIVGCECGKLYALDRLSGKTIWETDLPGEVKAAPAISDGVAYIGDYSGTMSAVRLNDGSIKWQSSSQGTGFSAGAFYGTAAVAFGRVYAGSKDGRVYSWEKESGDLAWSHTIGGEVYAGAVAADTPNTEPTVYFGVFGGSTFYALDARSGDERWSADAGGSVIGAASLIGETVYVANLDTTETYAFNAANGERIWTFRDGAYNPIISDGKRLYLTGYKTIYAMRPGKPKTGKPGGGKGDGKEKGGKK
ncbi:MAG TPA: PQQ-binding-like beta-propeller repeat protein [Solirubrobacterales bacterium]|nr:PQQ-binding-like beta-propeller repeat protein [Solirubrobacterales bacterium]